FSSTFGAALRNIDEFQVAAIGTASAVTGIADVAPDAVGDAFNQNLKAALVTFEKLELVAARFFSTGQELQLAFNTLAQRGVVIREDEFDTLGKITDQIKLLTGGQNTQIQIQQELRAILDGNVRTTTAFGKALQARGVDIGQLSRGSLKPFEPFLTGLDAAGPAIRRTLSSVTATFTSLASILNRRIFQETFDGVVEDITKINNFLIDNIDLLVGIGRGLIERVKPAFQEVLTIAGQFGSLIVEIATTDVGKLIIAFKILSGVISASPIGIFLRLAALLTFASGEASTLGDIINIAFGAIRILLNRANQAFEALISNLQNAIAFFKILDGDSEIGFFDVVALNFAESQLASVQGRVKEIRDSIKRTGEISVGQKKLLNQLLDEELTLVGEIEERRKAIRDSSAGQKFAKVRVEPSIEGDTIANFIRKIREEIDGTLKKEGLTGFEAKLDSLFERLKGLAIPVDPTEDEQFTKGADKVVVDTREEEARLKLARAGEDARLKAEASARKAAQNQALLDVKELAEAQKIGGEEAFTRTNALKEAGIKADKAALESALKLVEVRLQEDLAIIQKNLDADEGITKITDTKEADLKRIAAVTKAETAIGQLKITNNEKTAALEALRTKIATDLLKIERQITREIEKRDRDIAAFGGQTNRERAGQIDAESAIRQQDFNARVTDTGQRDRFAGQERLIRIQQAIEDQVSAITGAIEAVFDTLIDGIVEGSFNFRDAAKNISKDLIKSGLQGLIEETKDAVSNGLQKIFDGFSTEAAKRSAQALALGLGLLIAVLSRIGNDGDFTATGGSGGGGVDSSSIPTRGLVGGDTSLPIAQINNGLLEALIPTNNILAQIERNTRALTDLQVSIGDQVGNALSDGLNNFFDDQVLQNAQP
ncbi:MAG: hypothetical protein ACW99J_19925, partial [Candidatus Thorarchaeota archaeon]